MFCDDKLFIYNSNLLLIEHFFINDCQGEEQIKKLIKQTLQTQLSSYHCLMLNELYCITLIICMRSEEIHNLITFNVRPSTNIVCVVSVNKVDQNKLWKRL